MQTPSEHEKKQQEERSRLDSSSSSVPDLLGPSPAMMSPMDLVGRAIQGFCTPLEHLHQQQHQRATSSDSQANGAGADDNLSPRPRSCLRPASNLLNAFAVDASSSVSSEDDAEDEEEEQDDDDDDDESDLWLVETGPGTGRTVRVLRALEIFLGTVALLLLTLSVAQRLGVQLEWHPKSASDNNNQAAFVSLKQQQAQSHHGVDHKVIPPEETSTTDDVEQFCADGHVSHTTKTGESNASMTCSDT